MILNLNWKNGNKTVWVIQYNLYCMTNICILEIKILLLEPAAPTPPAIEQNPASVSNIQANPTGSLAIDYPTSVTNIDHQAIPTGSPGSPGDAQPDQTHMIAPEYRNPVVKLINLEPPQPYGIPLSMEINNMIR